jgi:5-methylcytosine-specific restriction enzyme subunit McrC
LPDDASDQLGQTTPAGFPNAALFQLLAYCTVFGLPVGHLIYVKGNKEPRQYTVQCAGIRLIAHSLAIRRL